MPPDTSRPAIEIRDLRKHFGRVHALDGLELRVREGEVHGFLGPNGAGKSTTIRILLGLVRADSGSVRVLGADPWTDAVALHRQIAYVPGDVTLWPSLTGGETIDLLGRMRGGIDERRRADLLQRFELDPHQKSRTYSKGNRQKVSLVSAFSSHARLLLLDEPSSGLDPLMENVFRQCVREACDRGTTVLLSSHILAETETLCERVTIIRAGRTVESGSLDSMRHLSRTAIKAELTGDPGDLSRIKGVENISIDGSNPARPRRQRQPRRAHQSARRRGGAQPGQPATDSGRAVLAALRRRRRVSPRTQDTEGPGMKRVTGNQHTSAVTGTFELLRLYLRRDRVVLPLWVGLLSVPLATVYVDSIEKLYPTQAARAGLVASIMASPAQRALYGPVYNDSLGATGIWKAGMFHLLIAVAVILTVIRHTRADEETGRTELIESTAVGRYASLTAALALCCGASIVVGVIGAGGLLSTDVAPAGSLAFGAALAGSGIVFTAVAAVTAQLSSSARIARGAAFSVLGAAFTVRAVGDAGSGALSWLSPLGWSLQVRPYAGDRWWVLILHMLTTVTLTALAYALLARRDVGAGLIAQRPGRATARPALRGAFGLAWRLDRGSVLLWASGLGLYGLLIGSIVHGIAEEVASSTAVRSAILRMGGSDALAQAFVAVAFGMLGMCAAAFVVSLTLRLHQEESSQRAETLLAGAVSRSRWLASHLSIALIGSAVSLLLAGLAAGVTYGVASGDVSGKLSAVLATAAVQLPAVWLLAAVTVALLGAAPRLAPAAWGVLVGFVALYLLGSILGVSQWLLDLEPFGHTPHVGRGFTATPLLVLSLIDAALIALGAAAFRRRDVRS